MIIRFVDNTSITQGGGGLLHEEPDELIMHMDAREEREAGGQHERENHHVEDMWAHQHPAAAP